MRIRDFIFKRHKHSKPELPCLVCGYITISRRGISEVCPICYWEDEGVIENPTELTYGPNGDLSLEVAKANFNAFGAVDKKFLKYVRRPSSDEIPKH